MTWQEYGEHLEENLQDLVARLKGKRYQPLPARRVYLRKDEHSQRPLGVPALEDKIVQKGIALLLEAIYEADFLDCSYNQIVQSIHRRDISYSERSVYRPSISGTMPSCLDANNPTVANSSSITRGAFPMRRETMNCRICLLTVLCLAGSQAGEPTAAEAKPDRIAAFYFGNSLTGSSDPKDHEVRRARRQGVEGLGLSRRRLAVVAAPPRAGERRGRDETRQPRRSDHRSGHCPAPDHHAGPAVLR